MSATNATPTINLPLFIGTDKPAWLTDWNGAMNVIDTSIASLQTAEGGTATALATLSQSVSALSDTVSQHTTAIQTVTTATAGNTGSINTINSLIGNGTPTTTDKTLIGAINEINAKIPEGGDIAAEDVTYDNTDSGLTADDVQAAINEVNGKFANIPSLTHTDITVTLAPNSSVTPFSHYGNADISGFNVGNDLIATQVLSAGSSERAIVNVHDNTLYVFGCSASTVTVRLTGIAK